MKRWCAGVLRIQELRGLEGKTPVKTTNIFLTLRKLWDIGEGIVLQHTAWGGKLRKKGNTVLSALCLKDRHVGLVMRQKKKKKKKKKQMDSRRMKAKKPGRIHLIIYQPSEHRKGRSIQPVFRPCEETCKKGEDLPAARRKWGISRKTEQSLRGAERRLPLSFTRNRLTGLSIIINTNAAIYGDAMK